jgi:hypothetical protein
LRHRATYRKDKKQDPTLLVHGLDWDTWVSFTQVYDEASRWEFKLGEQVQLFQLFTFLFRYVTVQLDLWAAEL